MPLTQEEEHLLIKNAHFVTDRMNADKPMAESHVRVFKELFPDLFSLLMRVQPEEAFEIYEKYKSHQVYHAEMEALLSPKGKEWVINELKMIREYAESR